MKSKEALKKLCKICYLAIGDRKTKTCPLRSKTGDYCEAYETVLKELTAFEILKPNINLLKLKHNNAVVIKSIKQEQYDLLEEVLPNEKTKKA